MVRRRKKETTVEEDLEKKKKSSYPIGDVIYNSRKDYTYFLKLHNNKLDTEKMQEPDGKTMPYPVIWNNL